MFQSAEERDTEGLSPPPSHLTVSIYIDMIEQDKQTEEERERKKKPHLCTISWQPHKDTQLDSVTRRKPSPHLLKCNMYSEYCDRLPAVNQTGTVTADRHWLYAIDGKRHDM